jgi:NhaP-type Na+/H+ or K+/H+ antiporter
MPFVPKDLLKRLKLFVTAFLVSSMLLTSILSGTARADETMQETLKSAIYGGIVGALIGSAAVLVTDNPDDHLDYIPTGAGIGIMLGAAYGVASSGVVQSLGSIEAGKFSWHIPTLNVKGLYDRNANATEVVESLDLLRVKF